MKEIPIATTNSNDRHIFYFHKENVSMILCLLKTPGFETQNVSFRFYQAFLCEAIIVVLLGIDVFQN